MKRKRHDEEGLSLRPPKTRNAFQGLTEERQQRKPEEDDWQKRKPEEDDWQKRKPEERNDKQIRTSEKDQRQMRKPEEDERQKRKPEERNDRFKRVCTDYNTSGMAADNNSSSVSNEVRKLAPENILGRTGGIYIPPFKLAAMKSEIKEMGSMEHQRSTWEALRKGINGLVNKVNVSNITVLVPELFTENLVRGRGLLARAILRAQMASPGFTHIYAAFLAIVNTKLPEVGDLVLRRVSLQFRRAYRRNDKIVCKACVKFIAHLVNQKVAHELLALQMAVLLLEKLTDDSVEICVEFMQDVGQVLKRVSPAGFQAISDRLHAILQEGQVDKRVQCTIEKFYDAVRNKFAEFPGILPELDLVEEDDQITHEHDLIDPDIKGDEMLNIFKAEEPEVFLKGEAEWQAIRQDILGKQEGENNDGDTSEDSEGEFALDAKGDESTTQVKDLTEQDIINLRKTVYLTFQSSATFEECVHKLLKMNIREGCEIEVCTMLIDSNAMERTFQRFFALQAERLCALRAVYIDCFLECLRRQYQTVHRLETNKLRNTAKFFAHLFYTNALPWEAFDLFVITEEATTSASRIFIKIVFQELAEHLGMQKLNERLHDPLLAKHLQGIFPVDDPSHMRFSINFFTAIGLGGLADPLRETLAAGLARLRKQESSSSAGSESSSSSSSESSSESSSHKRKPRRGRR